MLLTPAYLYTQVRLVTPLGVGLGGFEEFGGFGRVLLHHTREANLTFQEVGELRPVRFFGVDLELILAFRLRQQIVLPVVVMTPDRLLLGVKKLDYMRIIYR